jgi:chitin synthase
MKRPFEAQDPHLKNAKKYFPQMSNSGYQRREDRGRQPNNANPNNQVRRRSPERQYSGSSGFDRISPGSSVSQQAPYGQPQVPYQSSPAPYQYQQPSYQQPAPNYQRQQAQPYGRPQQQMPPMQQQMPPMQQQMPQKQMPAVVRKRTVRQIPLTPQGNLVIDVPVAERVSKMGKYAVGTEFTHMRYTAVTCSPDEFPTKGYSLRQQELQRETELFIVVTMYNEDDHLFCKSMQALMKNIAYLCSRSRSKVWGEEGWKKAIICIVSDGRAKVNARVLDVLGIMGVYQDGVMKDHVNGKAVTGHLFEYTTQVCVTPDLKVHGHEKGYVPVQILFCLKEKNAKKINSHRWFFNSFAPLLRPNVCVLIDVGTKPTHTSLYHLWKAFDINSSIGGGTLN